LFEQFDNSANGLRIGSHRYGTDYSERTASVVFTLLLVAAWRRYFGPKEASVLNRMVLWFNLLSRFLNGCRVPLETTDKIGTGTSPLENRTP